MSWLAQHFVNPSFVVGGTALVALPVLIHLINRMRFRRVRFAAMEFLLQSQRRNRRRILLEQLLLLLLRVVIVLGLVALIARLVLDPGRLSLFGGAKAHHVVLLDDSGSMRDRWGEQTAFSVGLDVVKTLAAEGVQRPNSQRFSLLLLSDPDQPVCSERDVNDAFLVELETQLENLRCSHRSFDLAAGIDAAGRLLAENPATMKHLHVVSDFRRTDWQEPGALAGAVRQVDEAGVSVNFVRTVGEEHANLAVTELTGDVHVAAARVPVRFRVVVKNFGKSVTPDVRLMVIQDGQRLPLSIHFDKIEAGTEVTREFDITFNSPGKHRMHVSLPADALAEDNTRYLAIGMADVNRVLIVDGDPSRSESAYLADALAADPALTGFAPRIESEEYLRRRPLSEFQSIFLLNVAELAPDAADMLEQYVAAGGGLAWFLGDAVKPAFYSQTLYEGKNGLFPVPLGPASRELSPDDVTLPGPDLRFEDHPIFRVFAGKENPYIDATRVYRYFPTADGWLRDDQKRRDGVRTIAWLRNKQPLMFAHEFGQGHVVTCLTSCGPSWNNWSLFASYVVLQLELQKAIARTNHVLEHRVVGQPIHETVDPAEFAEMVEIAAPSPAGDRITRIKAAPDIDRATPDSPNLTSSSDADGAPSPEALPAADRSDRPVRLTATFRDTDTPGIYAVRLIDRNQIPFEKWIAYNLPAEESDLEVATTAQIHKQLGEQVTVSIQEPGNLQWIAGRDAGQEVRQWLLLLLVAVMLAEQFLGYKLSYHPNE